MNRETGLAPTDPFTIIVPQDQEIGKFYEDVVRGILTLQICEKVGRDDIVRKLYSVTHTRISIKRY